MLGPILLLLPSLANKVSPTTLTEVIAVKGVFETGRRPFAANAVQNLLFSGPFSAPSAGDTIKDLKGELVTWTALKPGKDNSFESDLLGGGYAFAKWESPVRQVMLLQAEGDSVAYINGALRAGDPYSFGTLSLPFVARQGLNGFLFQCVRGRLKVNLVPPPKPVFLQGSGGTTPDVLPTDSELSASLTIVNATEKPLRGLALSVGGLTTVVPPVGPLTLRKAPYRFAAPKTPNPSLTVQLLQDGKLIDEKKISLRSRTTLQTHRRTFLSKVDGSVQAYSVNPAQKPDPSNAMILSLHGASVESNSQADAYSSKSWATLICPTNRGPFGFDWEDWGRLDAIEALNDAGNRYPHDAFRTSLTGHSMGGHGTWSVGTLFPDRFAAIAPSAGWISFQSYAGGLKIENPSPVEQTLLTSTGASDTLARATNLTDLGVYIIHGDADDNVPVTEARTMRETLQKFNLGLGYHEEPGAGHWWGHPDDSGASCVDWAPAFDQFARRRIPKLSEVRRVDFTTPNPVVSNRYHWLRILQQSKALEPSRVQIKLDPPTRTFRGTATNVESLSLDISGSLGSNAPVTVVLDGQTLKSLTPTEGRVILKKEAAGWKAINGLSADEKNPLRGSGFKNALRKNWIIVYGTSGDSAENAWMAGHARFLAELFSYRGNATPYVVSDADLNLEVAKQRDILLIGNSETNRCWDLLLKGSPIQVNRSGITVGTKVFNSGENGVLFCRPSRGVETMVAAIGVTGFKSMRLMEPLPIFTSGVAYPDYVVAGPECLTAGTKGVLAAGWFDNKWNLIE